VRLVIECCQSDSGAVSLGYAVVDVEMIFDLVGKQEFLEKILKTSASELGADFIARIKKFLM